MNFKVLDTLKIGLLLLEPLTLFLLKTLLFASNASLDRLMFNKFLPLLMTFACLNTLNLFNSGISKLMESAISKTSIITSFSALRETEYKSASLRLLTKSILTSLNELTFLVNMKETAKTPSSMEV